MISSNPDAVSRKAKERGSKQLGTLGGGNHFLEIQIVDEIFDAETAQVFGFNDRKQIAVMIHCGSRGLGHQVCTDYLKILENAYPDIVKSLPEKNLIYAPSGTDHADMYFKAMSASANYAWANRHIIGHKVRESFEQVFGNTVKLNTVYDVAHNIAKIEEHFINDKKRKVWMHRKGATRAFAPGHKDIPDKYKSVGQPVLIPGSMGTSSYLLKGTELAMKETFGTSAHGAGRNLSRIAAKKRFKADLIKKELLQKGIFVKSASLKGISEEAPLAYKDISEVIEVTHNSGIAKKVVKFNPLAVIKG